MIKCSTHVAVIGSGVAGLSAAAELARLRPDVRISIFSKAEPMSSNTAQAQGGVAAVMDSKCDSFQLHLHDTLEAGRNINNPQAAEILVREIPSRINDLISWGARFDRDENYRLETGLEGGHSASRVLHSRDQTGREIMNTLLRHCAAYPNIEFHHAVFATGLRVSESEGQRRCTGFEGFSTVTGEPYEISAEITILATGGCGQIFLYTTNPVYATGDGVALALKAGVPVSGMQHIQFHPTALWQQDQNPLFLISEAIRGFGAHIVNRSGKRFLFDTDPRGELATRDIVTAAIQQEMLKQDNRPVLMDFRHLDQTKLQQSFPTITRKLKECGYDISKELVPIVPAAHYQCGGIDTGLSGDTGMKSLYAVGECANTGVHGANRLASNSLSEGMVFGYRAAQEIAGELGSRLPAVKPVPPVPIGQLPPEADNRWVRLEHFLRSSMSEHCSGNAGSLDLSLCLLDIDLVEAAMEDAQKTGVEYFELRNMLLVAREIVNAHLFKIDINQIEYHSN